MCSDEIAKLSEGNTHISGHHISAHITHFMILSVNGCSYQQLVDYFVANIQAIVVSKKYIASDFLPPVFVCPNKFHFEASTLCFLR